MSSADAPYRFRAELGGQELFAEAERQLNICNSCRFCEGYCAVYPALERRNELTEGDIVYLANLCHDCRACLYACMYAPPHEFAVNPPAIFSTIRRATYDAPQHGGPQRIADLPSRMGPRAWTGLMAACVIGVVLTIVSATHGVSSLTRAVAPKGSPYAVITYATIITISLVLASVAVSMMAYGALRYWRRVRGPRARLFVMRAWIGALRDSATLRYLRGGSEGCYVKEGHASVERRMLHGSVAYGFLLCLVSTIAAGIEQDLLKQRVPFPVWSVPVVTGLIGGIGLVVGSLGLLRLKVSQDIVATDGPMTAKDRAFLGALALLGGTGIAVLVSRTSSVYGLALVVHLSVVWTCFVLAPLTKFVHFTYRVLALVQDRIEALG